jgi:hypothetical protein
LPTNNVEIEHIKTQIKIDCKDLKLAPYLNESCAGAALRYCVNRNLLNTEAITKLGFMKQNLDGSNYLLVALNLWH